MTAATSQQIPSLLRTLTDDVLSPSPARRSLAERRYKDLASYLEKHMAEKLEHSVRVYPQGSYRLGTTLVNPTTNEFDVDVVIAYDITRSDIGKAELVAQMHGWLVQYYLRGHGGGDLQPNDYDGTKRRAFTLAYPDDFHMDILPVVLEKPHPSNAYGQPSWLPDSSMTRWQPTNPRGFADYFDQQQNYEKDALAKRADVEVDELPRIGMKTSLQRAVMLCKRHRNVMFADDAAGLAPHSSLITALATAAYDASLQGVPNVHDVVAGLAGQIKFRDGELWVPNPTWKKNGVDLENYADRYAGCPDKVGALREWISTVEADLAGYAKAANLQARAQVLSKAFGPGLGERAAERHGQTVARNANRSGLHAAPAGLALGAANYPRPTFHGDDG